MRQSLSLLLFLLLAAAPAAAQRVVKSAEQQFVENAVASGLFCARHGYQLSQKESGERFGRDGRDEFGAGYGLGVKLPAGFALTAPAVRPWEYDETFADYAADYAPVPLGLGFSALAGPMQFRPMEDDTTQSKSLCGGLLTRYAAPLFGDTAFVLDPYFGEKEGWMVWVVANGTPAPGVATDFVAYRHQLSLVQDSASYALRPPILAGSQRPLGGVFVVPAVAGVGRVELRLCGVAVPFPDGQWRLGCPFATRPAPVGGELTPASQQEDRKPDRRKKKKKEKRDK